MSIIRNAAAILLVAGSTFMPAVSAHNALSYPLRMYGSATEGPISASNYPCAVPQGQLSAVIAQSSKSATLTSGQTFNVQFSSQTFHGGGSCQFSLSLDNGASFQVIQTNDGGCPAAAGLNMTLPSNLPSHAGALFAWTWLPKLSGGPEFYMSCALVDLVGAPTGDLSKLPNMFVGVINTCQPDESPGVLNLMIPNPGTNLVVDPTLAALNLPEGYGLIKSGCSQYLTSAASGQTSVAAPPAPAASTSSNGGGSSPGNNNGLPPNALWAKCGGGAWTGSTACVVGAYCQYYDQWYSQCVQGSAPAASAPGGSSVLSISSSVAPAQTSPSTTSSLTPSSVVPAPSMTTFLTSTLSSQNTPPGTTSVNSAPSVDTPSTTCKPLSSLSWCNDLVAACSKTSTGTNLFMQKTCIAAALCVGDASQLLAGVACRGGPNIKSSSVSLDYVTLYSSIVGKCAWRYGGCAMTRQNFIDLIYGGISSAGTSNYPADVGALVTSFWAPAARWAGFGDSMQIPYTNLQDWLRYYTAPTQITSSTSTSAPAPAQTSASCSRDPNVVQGCVTAFQTCIAAYQALLFAYMPATFNCQQPFLTCTAC